MKCRIFLGAILLWTTVTRATDFNGATPAPLGTSPESISQLQIKFPGTIEKATSNEPFKVVCSPAVEGYSSWADNDTVWTYNFKAKDEESSAKLVGGSRCQVTQVNPLKAGDKSWPVGTINYYVTVDGPNVDEVLVAHGFKDTLRETDPVMMIVFDGPVDRTKFFADQSGILNYLSSNAPSEKLPLIPVPAEQNEKIFNHFRKNQYINIEYKDKNWILASVKQNLIPGAQVALTVQNQTSGDNAEVRATKKYSKEFSVRSQFQAEVRCANPSAKNATCLPRSAIAVALNGHVKWNDAKQAYIEYIPYNSKDGKLVRSYPELGEDQQVSLWESFVNSLANYFPWLERFSDTVVDVVNFNVNIEPESQAKIVLPKGLTDIDGRLLSNAIAEFHVRIGTMAEVIRVPQQVSFFERNVPNLYLPVGVINLNQKLSIRKTGTDPKVWAPIREVPEMIRILRAYDIRGRYRSTPEYQSPLDTLKVKNTRVDQQLTGTKNRPSFLQFPFGTGKQTPAAGFYAIEISSPTYEKGHSNNDDQYYNPKYVLAQVTDLAVHLKKGKNSTVAWVTKLSEAQPVAGADVEIYNCNGEKVQSLKTNASGLVTFANQTWAKDCHLEKGDYSSYASVDHFFVAARAGDDLAVSHSSWTSSNSYAMGAPGIEWYYSDLQENEPHFHSVIGVNLVKPGQQVPIELFAKVPNAKGFAEVPATKLPSTARIVNAEDRDTYFELPLTWKNGVAEITWNVPAADAAKLGRYSVVLVSANAKEHLDVSGSDIEVAEFKIPLMSGIMAFPNQPLVKPDSIPVSAVVRYANGVGAKKIGLEMSYYFQPTSMESKQLSDFNFGAGPVKLNEDEGSGTPDALPRNNRPATLQGLVAGEDGAITKDLAQEKTADGRTIAAVLKESGRPQKMVVRVRYQDQMGEFQTISQAKDIFNSSEYVGTKLVSGNRAQARLQAAVLDVHHKNVTDINDLEFKVVRVDTKVIGEELFGGLIKNSLERQIKSVRWNEACILQSQIANCAVGALKAGNYAFEVTSKRSHQMAHTLFKVDSEGRVYGENDYYHFGDDENNKQLPLALDKKSYKDGDRAVVSFPSPFKSCRALVTIERSDVMESYIVNNACEKGFVEVPVNASQAPNAFVSVYAITGRAKTAALQPGEMDLGRPTYRLGFANMKVNWNRFRSTVKVTTNKEKYQPGENVEVQVSVTPEEGSLHGGTATLVAIEEKILELKANDTYNLLNALMQLRGHEVQTITPLEKVETVTADNTDIPSEDSRKGGDEGGDGSSKSEFKRKLFNALVTFQPGVPVVNGIAKFSFKTNDSLTKFKIFAISNDAGQKFGTGEVSYLTEKDTQSYSNIPAIAHTGDNFPIKVTVQNNSGKASKFRTEVTAVIKDANGKVIANKTLTKEASIAASGSQAIEVGKFPIDDEASRIEYLIHVYDQNGKLVDSMEPEAQVVLASVPLSVSKSYIVQMTDSHYSQEFTKELNALEKKGQIKVTVAKSLVTGALKQIQNRVARETLSDVYLESRFQRALLMSSESKPQELKAALEAIAGQVDSEGFIKSYAQAPRGSVWLTASVINSLQQEPWTLKLVPRSLFAKMHGAVSEVLTKSVDPAYVGKRPIDWVRAQAVMGRAAFAFGDANLIDNAKAVNATFVATLQKDPLAFGEPVEKWSNSDLVDVWLLEVFAAPATALQSAIYKQLTGPARLIYSGNMAALNGAPKYFMFYTDETRETADLLLGHSKLKGGKDLARALAIGLVNANIKAWYNVGTMMSVSESLKVFGKNYETEAVSGTALVAIEPLQRSTVDWQKSAGFELATAWPDNKATVQVTQSGQGQPWVAVEALTAVPLTAAKSQGLSIEKEIRNVTRESGYTAGDIVEVTLTIHSAGLVQDIAMLDPIPAGANILNDAYGSYGSGQKSYSGYKFYFPVIPAGVMSVKYQYQLNNPGTFKLPPTHVQGLNMSSIFADLPNSTMTVK